MVREGKHKESVDVLRELHFYARELPSCHVELVHFFSLMRNAERLELCLTSAYRANFKLYRELERAGLPGTCGQTRT